MSSVIGSNAKWRAAFVGWRSDFYGQLTESAGVMAPVTTVIQSNSPEENYTWLGSMPGMREWIGERVVNRLRAEKWTIVNKDWEVTVAVDRDDIRYDKFGKIMPQILSLADAVEAKKDELLTDLLVGGFTQYGYDGQYFFDTDHTTGGDGSGESYSNKGTTALGTDGTALDAALLNMATRVNDRGQPLAVSPTHLIYGPKLESVVRTLIKTPTLSGGGDNPFYNRLTPIMNPRLIGDYDDYWFLVDASKSLKPFVLQEVGRPNLVQKTAPTDDNVFWEKEYIVGVDATFNAGYAFPQLVFGAIVA
jgi:phage major head subunit gpT-like protein